MNNRWPSTSLALSVLLLSACGSSDSNADSTLPKSTPIVSTSVPSATIASSLTPTSTPPPSTTTVPLTLDGPFSAEVVQRLVDESTLGPFPEGLQPLPQVMNQCAQSLALTTMESFAPVLEGYNPPYFLWLKADIDRVTLAVTFPPANAGPPLSNPTPVVLATGQTGTMGTVEGSLFATFPEPAPGCESAQIITGASDPAVFAILLQTVEL